jgi:hypothetical protein
MTDKIAIDRDFLEHAVVALEYAYNAEDEMVQESIKYLRAALAQKAEPPAQEPWKCVCGANLYIDENGKPRSKASQQECALQKIADFGQEQEPVAWLRFQEHENRPTTIHLCDSDHPKALKVYATLPQPPKPQCSSLQAKSLALLDLDSVEHMQGGANGPTIRLRGFINAQTGQTAPQPPIDNAFVAEGCEQFSPPAEPAPVPCCGKYETCSHACTPRGKWLSRREAESEIENLRTNLVSCRGTVKTELAHYERLAMVHGKTVLATNYEAEAQRLSDLLDRIDAMKAGTTKTKAAGEISLTSRQE